MNRNNDPESKEKQLEQIIEAARMDLPNALRLAHLSLKPSEFRITKLQFLKVIYEQPQADSHIIYFITRDMPEDKIGSFRYSKQTGPEDHKVLSPEEIPEQVRKEIHSALLPPSFYLL